ncbi:transcription factor FapR [Salsuginibacillus halophilus]|uniref:transcription factor FapR n=1 Tax=Salsuginibacillus halophilus TaxID=517424 RepID=UPI00249E9E7F|nr:transcription factor FapR [Salsuginibacillus halophilus]
MAKRPKAERQQELQEMVDKNPFTTDEALSEAFEVSVQTIRLDRMALGIPELRERIKHVARRRFDEVKALGEDEVIGEIVDLTLDHTAISVLDIQKEHVFSRTGIARGHHLFAQANSLAVAIIDEALALTASSEVQFIRQVKEGERVVAKAVVKDQTPARTVVGVESYVGSDHVFSGTFRMYRTGEELEGGKTANETSN